MELTWSSAKVSLAAGVRTATGEWDRSGQIRLGTGAGWGAEADAGRMSELAPRDSARPVRRRRRAIAVIALVAVAGGAAVALGSRGKEPLAVQAGHRPGGTPVADGELGAPGADEPAGGGVVEGLPAPMASTTGTGVVSPLSRRRPPTTTTTTRPSGPGSSTTVTTERPPPTMPVPTTTVTAPSTAGTTTTTQANSQAPRARSMTVNPKTIDTSAGPVPVTVLLRVTDDQGDTRMTSVTVRFAACGVQVHDVPYEAWRRISGDGYDGTYEAQLIMYRYSAQGFWRFDNVMLGDEANNYRYQFAADLPQAEFDRGFDQTGLGDCDVPHLAGFSISPTVVDGAGTAPAVTVTARITDAQAGVGTTPNDPYDGGEAFITSPSGQQLYAWFGYMQVVGGDAHDATYRCTVTLPTNPERGTWLVHQVHLADRVGNQTSLWQNDLSSAGFPTSFQVE